MTNFSTITDTISSTKSAFQTQFSTAESLAGDQKFFPIEKLWGVFRDLGLSVQLADLVAFAAAALAIAALIWLIDLLIVKVALTAIKAHSKKSKTQIDDVLVETKFFARLLQIVPIVALLLTMRIFFAGFDEDVILYARLAVFSYLTINVLLVIYSLLNAWNEIYSRRPEATRKSIKGYLQVAKIVLGFIAGIAVLSILLQKDPSNLFVGLGATAALFSLVFKDTILGFVASIQLSAQDMVRPGDWIEMPSQNADGTVLDINVNSVKVQNWDNTITMIPIYSMVSEAFTNWRGMEQSTGRRFVRKFFINLSSVRFSDDALMSRLEKSSIVQPTLSQVITLATRSSSSVPLTNLGLFRAHLEIFLREHPKVNSDLTIYVRYQTDMTDKGVGMEIYAFSIDKEAQLFDAVHRSVVEYVVAVAGIFDIVLFQAPSGRDVEALARFS